MSWINFSKQEPKVGQLIWITVNGRPQKIHYSGYERWFVPSWGKVVN